MENIDYKLISEMVLNTVSLFIYAYCLIKQLIEVAQPKDGLTKLRWFLLFAMLAAVINTIPVVVYQIARLTGVDSDALRSLASTGGSASRFGGAMLVLLIYTYRKRDD